MTLAELRKLRPGDGFLLCSGPPHCADSKLRSEQCMLVTTDDFDRKLPSDGVLTYLDSSYRVIGPPFHSTEGYCFDDIGDDGDYNTDGSMRRDDDEDPELIYGRVFFHKSI